MSLENGDLNEKYNFKNILSYSSPPKLQQLRRLTKDENLHY
jgi:hypothetical protein